MPTLSTDLRNQLERTCIAARNVAERAAKDALQALAVANHEPYGHMKPEQRRLRNKLRARARQLGETQDVKGQLEINHLAQECAYEQWHRMLFARFLAENNLLIEPESGVSISLEECSELAKGAKTNPWALAGRYAQTMLPEIFRADDPVLGVGLAREDQLKLEELLDALANETFTASDSLGWCYQFWQAERKNHVNAGGNKIGAAELPAVTQLFTEDYMVDFLLDNTLGAWHSAKILAANRMLAEQGQNEEELRNLVALPGSAWKYLRFSKAPDGKWSPAAGTFEGWPRAAKELKCLDPCMGSGHFVIAMFERLVSLRIAEEQLDEAAAVAAVIRDNLFGLEIDPRCTQIAAFNLALAAWRRIDHCKLPAMTLACSGLAPNAKKEDWLKLAGSNERLQRGMARLYALFKDAPVLGSLIDPRLSADDMFVADYHELQPLMGKALARETTDDATHEMAVTARGLAKAAEILAGQFTLIATNVPFLGYREMHEDLIQHLTRFYPDERGDLGYCLWKRFHGLTSDGVSIAVVTLQHWLSLRSYTEMRKHLFATFTLSAIAHLGTRAFETITGEKVNVTLTVTVKSHATQMATISLLDAAHLRTPREKAEHLKSGPLISTPQDRQFSNPDHRVSFGVMSDLPRLSEYADCLAGIMNGDSPKFIRCFWELPEKGHLWAFLQSTVSEGTSVGGLESIILFDEQNGHLREDASIRRVKLHNADERGNSVWGREGVAISQMSSLPASRYFGNKYDSNVATIVPTDINHLPAIWTYCSSDSFRKSVRAIDRKLNVTNATFGKIPFDLAYWQKAAADKYPRGLPKPFASDPTQWLFNGHPKGSAQPLHVAVARLLGYQWPRQTGSSFPDCPALGPDGLEELVDDTGIVCVPSVRGNEPAADRLRKLLAFAFGEDWEAHTEMKLIRAAGSEAAELEEWLRNEFFEQHCDLFHQRPFVWHVWDGRRRDGFHALINYHKMCEGGAKGRSLLESLTHSYLGEWISRQRDGIKRGEGGADDRLAAALELQSRLKLILEGEPPFDIFVRWKPLTAQAIGWQPDIDDGVRMNIRPFLASDVPGGRNGAGVLRYKPHIKWDKDRGKEPVRPKKEYPWFWGWDDASDEEKRGMKRFDGGTRFDGNRNNACHYSNEAKQAARGGEKRGHR